MSLERHNIGIRLHCRTPASSLGLHSEALAMAVAKAEGTDSAGAAKASGVNASGASACEVHGGGAYGQTNFGFEDQGRECRCSKMPCRLRLGRASAQGGLNLEVACGSGAHVQKSQGMSSAGRLGVDRTPPAIQPTVFHRRLPQRLLVSTNLKTTHTFTHTPSVSVIIRGTLVRVRVRVTPMRAFWRRTESGHVAPPHTQLPTQYYRAAGQPSRPPTTGDCPSALRECQRSQGRLSRTASPC